jgi:hypothetical protein
VGVDLLGHGPANVHIPEANEGKRTPPPDLDSLGRASVRPSDHDPLQDREESRPGTIARQNGPISGRIVQEDPLSDRTPLQYAEPPLDSFPTKTLTGETPLLSAAGNVHPCVANPSLACFELNGQPVTVGTWLATGPASQPSPPSKPGNPVNGRIVQINPLSDRAPLQYADLPAGPTPSKTLTGESPLLSNAGTVVQCYADPNMACFILNGQPVTVGTWAPTGVTTQPSPPPKTSAITPKTTHTVKTTHHAKHCHTTVMAARPHDFDIPPTKTI